MKKRYDLNVQICTKEERKKSKIPLIVDFENKEIFVLNYYSAWNNKTFEIKILEKNSVELEELKVIIKKQYINGKSKTELIQKYGEIAGDIIDNFKKDI